MWRTQAGSIRRCRPATIARRAASGLRSLGVGRDDRVLVWLPNGPDVLRAWFGANLAGACFAPLNLAYRGRLLTHAIEQSGAKVMVIHAGLLDRLAEIPQTAIETLVVVGRRPPGSCWPAGRVVDADVRGAGGGGGATAIGRIGSRSAFISARPPRDDGTDHTLRFSVVPLPRHAVDLARRHG